MLYLCSTPIGNLEDITLRVLRILREADVIWAEDTRRTLSLLNHYGIKKPLQSYNEHNASERESGFLRLMRENKTLAYCSDAGMPAIQDPGSTLCSLCYEHNFPVSVLPGASSVLMAAVLSGYACQEFCFLGFFPRDKAKSAAITQRIKHSDMLSLIFESPKRLHKTLSRLKQDLGPQRRAAVCRELTKLYEQTVRGSLDELCQSFDETTKGECVIAIEGKSFEPEPSADTDEALRKLFDNGFSLSDAVLAVSLLTGVKKNEAYTRAIAIREK